MPECQADVLTLAVRPHKTPSPNHTTKYVDVDRKCLHATMY